MVQDCACKWFCGRPVVAGDWSRRTPRSGGGVGLAVWVGFQAPQEGQDSPRRAQDGADAERGREMVLDY